MENEVQNINIITKGKSSKNIFISVIMSVYNSAKYLDECMMSITNQTLKNIEIICIDDGSTDNSLEILKKYAENDDRIVIVTQKNQYAGVARNNGFKLAKGKYVIFLDSDDFFEPEMLKLLYKKAEFEKSEICIFETIIYDQKTGNDYISRKPHVQQFFERNKSVMTATEIGANLFVLCKAAPWDKLYLRSFVEINSLEFQNIQNANDVAFVFTSLALAKRITFLPTALLHYRINTGSSLQQTRHSKKSFSFIEAFKELKKNLIKHSLYDDFKIQFANICCDHICFNLRGFTEKETFLELYEYIKNNAVSEFDLNLLDINNIIYMQTFNRVYDIFTIKPEEYSQKYEEVLQEQALQKYEEILREQGKNLLELINNDWIKHKKLATPEMYEEEILKIYEYCLGKSFNFNNPKTFNEKIQWLKLYDSTPIKTRLADKYLVREWIKEQIGDEYLIPLLGVWDSFDEIDFEKLPDKFALKTNHSYNRNYIIKNKNDMDKNDMKSQFEEWFKLNLAVPSFELHYLNIPPKIIAEQYIENYKGDLHDYKFMCFDGKVEFLWICNEIDGVVNRVFFTPRWKKMNVRFLDGTNIYGDTRKPENLEKMLKLVEKLSKGFACVRIDLYDVNGKVYFGEMTFTPNAGYNKFIPEKFDLKCGKMLKLPEKSPIPVKLDID